MSSSFATPIRRPNPGLLGHHYPPIYPLSYSKTNVFKCVIGSFSHAGAVIKSLSSRDYIIDYKLYVFYSAFYELSHLIFRATI